MRTSRPKPTSAVRLTTLPGKDGDWASKELAANPKHGGKLRPAPVRNICAKNLRPVEKIAKIKHGIDEQEVEKKVAINTVQLGLNCTPADGEPSTFKQSPKRLKMCKNESEVLRTKKTDWIKDGNPSAELGVFPRSAGTSTDVSTSIKKRPLKPRPQLSPIKHKKSLEKRRNSDKKSKILYKKASKLSASAGDLAKSDRKRRNAIN